MKATITSAGVLTLFIMCLLVSPGYGASFFSAGFKVGADVNVDAGETVEGELVVAGANLDLAGDFKEGLKAFGANISIFNLLIGLGSLWLAVWGARTVEHRR
jgi:hypothetical protein